AQERSQCRDGLGGSDAAESFTDEYFGADRRISSQHGGQIGLQPMTERGIMERDSNGLIEWGQGRAAPAPIIAAQPHDSLGERGVIGWLGGGNSPGTPYDGQGAEPTANSKLAFHKLPRLLTARLGSQVCAGQSAQRSTRSWANQSAIRAPTRASA